MDGCKGAGGDVSTQGRLPQNCVSYSQERKYYRFMVSLHFVCLQMISFGINGYFYGIGNSAPIT